MTSLRSDTTALANRGLIDRARLAGFKGLVGYKNVAFELIDYANLMRDCWARIQGRTAIQADEVQKAKQLGERLVLAAGQREQGPAVVVETARIRQQALTLLLNAYDETRRAVTFLRWHSEDADTVAPSLYAGRVRAKAAVPSAPAPEPVPAPTPTVPPVAVTNGHAVTPIAPGLPGASPFI